MSKKKKEKPLLKPLSATPGNKIKAKDVLEDINYPLFCFKYLSDVSIKNCTKHKFFFDFLKRLQKLSELGWDGIRKSGRHQYGLEQIPTSIIKPQIPSFVTPEVKELHAFRANGNNLPFVGLQRNKIFHVFFIETEFDDIYPH